MSEDFLHYLWKYRLFDYKELRTTEGDEVEIKAVGEHNFNSGPDFFNSKVKIGHTLWAGNVEIHQNTSDWLAHGHQKDKAYDNIILHVVLNHDAEITRKDGSLIPTIELKNRINGKLFGKYESMMGSRSWIPCQNQLANYKGIKLEFWLDRLLIERLEQKSEGILRSLKLNKNNWEETFYQQMARSFGGKVNSQPFELLARSLPVKYLFKHKDDLKAIEALLFGQAGFLEEEEGDEEYYKRLKKDYDHFRNIYNLSPIDKHVWKFSRMRPLNFPTIRIAQFAALIYNTKNLFSRVIESTEIVEIENLLAVKASEFWDTYYRFGVTSPKKEKKLGKTTIDTIIINTIVPFLFVYGSKRSDESYKDRSLNFLQGIAGETNGIISRWEKLGMPVKNAYHTQALLQLRNEYCIPKKCLSCNIGIHLLKN